MYDDHHEPSKLNGWIFLVVMFSVCIIGIWMFAEAVAPPDSLFADPYPYSGEPSVPQSTNTPAGS